MYRRLFLAVLALWLVFPVLLYGQGAQDGVTLLVGGDLVGLHPDAVYPGNEAAAQSSPPYVDSFCAIHPPIDSCRRVLLVFSSPPQSLPILGAVQLLPRDLAILTLRVVAAAALAGGMWLLWRRLYDKSPGAPRDLFLTALLLTPFAADPVALGQNTPLLFLLVCVGTRHARRGRTAVAVGGMWAVASAFKAFPLALGGVLAWQGRWRALAVGGAALAALTVLAWWLGGSTVFGGYLDQLGANSTERITSDANGSLSAVLQPWFPSLSGADGVTLGFVALRVALLVPLTWATMRLRDPDTQWAFASLAVLIVFPLVTWHYVWLGIAAAATALAERPRPDRVMGRLPLLAAVVFVAEMLFIAYRPVPLVMFGLLVACGAVTLSAGERTSGVSRSKALVGGR